LSSKRGRPVNLTTDVLRRNTTAEVIGIVTAMNRGRNYAAQKEAKRWCERADSVMMSRVG